MHEIQLRLTQQSQHHVSIYFTTQAEFAPREHKTPVRRGKTLLTSMILDVQMLMDNVSHMSIFFILFYFFLLLFTFPPLLYEVISSQRDKTIGWYFYCSW